MADSFAQSDTGICVNGFLKSRLSSCQSFGAKILLDKPLLQMIKNSKSLHNPLKLKKKIFKMSCSRSIFVPEIFGAFAKIVFFSLLLATNSIVNDFAWYDK